MGKRLTDNLNSNYIDAANYLRPGGRHKRRIVAYVESYDDIAFWRNVLSEFEDDTREFQVMLPSRTNLSRGKKQAMTNRLGNSLGKSMIACVDADLDYLMQGHTPYSSEMLNNPYIFHTYVYAIENYKCYAPSIHDAIVSSTLNDRTLFDFENYFKAYSQIVYELLVWVVWLYRQQRYGELPLNSFLNIVLMRGLNIFSPERAMNALRSSVQRKVSSLQRNFPSARVEIEQLKDELATLGCTRDNCYLFVQGHHIMDNVCMAAVEPVCTILRREREKEIKHLAGKNHQQMENELASYQHSQIPISESLRRNTNFHSCPLYQRLRADIIRFLSRYGGAKKA